MNKKLVGCAVCKKLFVVADVDEPVDCGCIDQLIMIHNLDLDKLLLLLEANV